MATSGTTSFNLNFTEIAEEAFERAGGEMRSGYDLRTARRSLSLMLLEWANRGYNLWTLDTATLALTPGTYQYTLGADVVDLVDSVIRTGAGSASTQADVDISRISMSTYSSIPNKLQTGRPIQMVVDRQIDAPHLLIWPVPDSAQTYSLVYWYLRRMEDPGSGVQTQDVPFRMLPALVAGLAYYLSMKLPEGASRLQTLKSEYDAQWGMASGEDREKASVSFVPRGYRV